MGVNSLNGRASIQDYHRQGSSREVINISTPIRFLSTYINIQDQMIARHNLGESTTFCCLETCGETNDKFDVQDISWEHTKL